MRAERRDLSDLLRRARRLWRLRILARGVLLGMTAASLVVAVLALAVVVGTLPTELRPLLRWAPAVALLVPALGALAIALGRAPSDGDLALRAGEVQPTVGHLYSVLLELPSDHPYGEALRRAARKPLKEIRPAFLVGSTARSPEWGGVLMVTAVAASLVLTAGGPAKVWSDWGVGSQAGSLGSAAALTGGQEKEAVDPTDVLSDLTLVVVPPQYTGLDAREISLAEGALTEGAPGDTVHIASGGSATSSEGTVRAVVGSQLQLRGADGPSVGPWRVHLLRSDGDIDQLEVGPGWETVWTLEETHRGLVVSAGSVHGAGTRERVIPLDPILDSPPAVELLEPERDLVLARGSGEVTFRARALDRFGVQSFELGWIHTRGAGESFDFREGTREWSTVEETPEGLEGTLVLDLDDLGLDPGEVLHLRATATDRNTVTGPGVGTSRTRQIRIIREGEEMEVDALAGFPLELDQEPILSQRMILLLTEELLEQAAGLEGPELAREASRIARHQMRLRDEVGEQVFSRATGAEAPTTEHLGGGLHSHDESTAHAHGHEHELLARSGDHAHGEEGTEVRRGSAYGVASIFDPSAPDTTGATEVPVPTGPDRMADAGMDAGTNVGAWTLGGRDEMPVGFGVLPELGHQHDGDPIISVNEPLLAIYNAMWESAQHLELADPEGSIPAQQEALAGLQDLRETQRVFPRGTVTAPPVDVVGVRGTGEVDDVSPAVRAGGRELASAIRWAGELSRLLESWDGSRLSGLAASLLSDDSVPREVAIRVVRAADRSRQDDQTAARQLVREALQGLAPAPARENALWIPTPGSVVAALATAEPPEEGREMEASAGEPAAPFVFATLRYESGNWDSGPLVPQNLIHSLAQYTDLPVASEGVVVDLASSEIFQYPVLYLTGHLPVRFSEAEARNLERYVQRGGFVFMDDHNHDVDGAFHRTATAELARIFGDEALEPLPNDHELYGAFFHFEDGPPTTSHELSGWGDGLIHPELHAIEVNGRIGILYSNKDYSSEWNYHAVNKRFLAVDNTRFGVNILIYALTR